MVWAAAAVQKTFASAAMAQPARTPPARHRRVRAIRFTRPFRDVHEGRAKARSATPCVTQPETRAVSSSDRRGRSFERGPTRCTKECTDGRAGVEPPLRGVPADVSCVDDVRRRGRVRTGCVVARCDRPAIGTTGVRGSRMTRSSVPAQSRMSNSADRSRRTPCRTSLSKYRGRSELSSPCVTIDLLVRTPIKTADWPPAGHRPAFGSSTRGKTER